MATDQEYTIAQAMRTKTGNRQSDGRPYAIWAWVVQDAAGQQQQAETVTGPDEQFTAGQKVEGRLEADQQNPGQLKFFRKRAGGGGGGGGRQWKPGLRDDAVEGWAIQAGIIHQHSQTVAVQLLALEAPGGLPDNIDGVATLEVMATKLTNAVLAMANQEREQARQRRSQPAQNGQAQQPAPAPQQMPPSQSDFQPQQQPAGASSTAEDDIPF